MSPAWLAKFRAALRRKRGIPRDRKARERIAGNARMESWGEITDETRAADRKRLGK